MKETLGRYRHLYTRQTLNYGEKDDNHKEEEGHIKQQSKELLLVSASRHQHIS